MFAYLSHSLQYGGTRVLSFLGTCDHNFKCEWPPQGQGQYDHSPDFVASQSFDDPRGRRVLFGWVNGPRGSKFTGAQSIPRMIVADDGGPLRFLPLPELSSLHTSNKSFRAELHGRGREVLVHETTNSFHLNATFELGALTGVCPPRLPDVAHPRACGVALRQHRHNLRAQRSAMLPPQRIRAPRARRGRLWACSSTPRAAARWAPRRCCCCRRGARKARLR